MCCHPYRHTSQMPKETVPEFIQRQMAELAWLDRGAIEIVRAKERK